MVSVVLDNLADGLTPAEVAAEYPPLTMNDVHATLAYAADTLKLGRPQPNSR